MSDNRFMKRRRGLGSQYLLSVREQPYPRSYLVPASLGVDDASFHTLAPIRIGTLTSWLIKGLSKSMSES